MTASDILSTYGDLINASAQQYGIDATEIAATIQTESSGNPNAFRAEAHYPPGSYGLMQVLYTTAKSLGYSGAPEGLYDPATNIDLGTHLLANLHAQYGNDNPEAIYSAYNSGNPDAFLTNGQVASNVQRFMSNLSSVAGQAAAAVEATASEAGQAIADNPGTSTGLIIGALVLLFLLTRK